MRLVVFTDSWGTLDAFPPLAAALGLQPVFAGLTAEGGCDLVDIYSRITTRTRLVIICTPNTPAGV